MPLTCTLRHALTYMPGRALRTLAGEQLIAAGLPQRAAHGPGVQQPRRLRRRARVRLEQGQRRVKAGRPGRGRGVRAGRQQRHGSPVRHRAGRQARGVCAAVCSAAGRAGRRQLVLCLQSLPRRNAVCIPCPAQGGGSRMCERGTEACAALPGRLQSSTAVRQHCCMGSSCMPAVEGCGLMCHAPASRRAGGGWPAHGGRVGRLTSCRAGRACCSTSMAAW